MAFGLSRRSFLRVSAAASALTWSRVMSFATSRNSSAVAVPDRKKEPGRLFPSGLKGSQWNTFQAAGYEKDVSGICYRTKAAGYFTCYVDKLYPCSGMPLGGIDTGALYLEPSGVLGYSSIFNHLTPIGGPLNVPYMGVASGGRSWVCGTSQTKNYAGNNRATMGVKVLGSMQESDYWGTIPLPTSNTNPTRPFKLACAAGRPLFPGTP
jgi:hypothetical protein